jgi:hypothetical protein
VREGLHKTLTWFASQEDGLVLAGRRRQHT